MCLGQAIDILSDMDILKKQIDYGSNSDVMPYGMREFGREARGRKKLRIKYGVSAKTAFWVVRLSWMATLLVPMVLIGFYDILIEDPLRNLPLAIVVFAIILSTCVAMPVVMKKLFVSFGILPNKPLPHEQQKLLRETVTGYYKWAFIISTLMMISVAALLFIYIRITT